MSELGADRGRQAIGTRPWTLLLSAGGVPFFITTGPGSGVGGPGRPAAGQTASRNAPGAGALTTLGCPRAVTVHIGTDATTVRPDCWAHPTSACEPHTFHHRSTVFGLQMRRFLQCPT